jgi:hypothetical protein
MDSASSDHAEHKPSPTTLSVYEQTCQSYRSIDDFRAKLLGFLPIASAGGLFLVVQARPENDNQVLIATGLFGIIITLGLLTYEIYGIKRCHLLIESGRRLELDLEVKNGQFQQRPREVAGYINEPFATSLIYPAVLAGWAFVAVQTGSRFWAACIAVLVFAVVCGLVIRYNRILRAEAVTWRNQVGVCSTTSPKPPVNGPRIEEVNPTSGTAGTAVTLSGSGLAEPTSVRFGETAATVNSSADATVTVTAPEGQAGIVNVTVTTAGGRTSSSFTYNE